MRKRLVLAVGLTSVVLLGLAALHTSPAVARRFAQQPTQDDWQTVDLEHFSIELPPNWEYVEQQGRDSFVGLFRGDDMELAFDFGWYSNPLPDPREPGYGVRHEWIGGRWAKVVWALEPPATLTGVHFPVAAPAPLPPTPQDMLTVVGQDLSYHQQAFATEILRTIRFPDVLGARSGAWRIQAAPEGIVPLDIEMLGPDEGWAVGAKYLSADESACGVLRYDGSAWTEVPCPGKSIAQAVAMESSQRGWAVANDTILRYESDAWTVVSDTVDGLLFDIAMPTPDEGWATGLQTLLHYRDGSWTRYDGEATGLALDMLSADRGFLVGQTGPDGSNVYELADGEWSPVLLTTFDANILGVDAFAENRVWMSGALDDPPDGNPPPTDGALVRYLGDGISDILPFRDAGPLWDVEVVPHDSLATHEGWLVGGEASSGPATIIHLQGSVSDQVTTRWDGFLKSVDMLDASEGWAVGSRTLPQAENAVDLEGMLLHYTAYSPLSDPTYTPVPTPSDTPSPPGESSTIVLPWSSVSR